MAKIDQFEDSKKILNEVALVSNTQRFLVQDSLTTVQLRQKSYSFLFDLVKRELSSRLSVLEAYFISSVEFEEFNDCDDILKFFSDIVQSLVDYTNSDEAIEEGGTEDA